MLSRKPPSLDLEGQRIVVTGAAGQLGRYLVPVAQSTGAKVLAMGSRPAPGVDIAADLTDFANVQRALSAFRPQIIIHAAACTDVDGIEREPIRGQRGNLLTTRHVACAAGELDAYMLSVSTDMVFSGRDGGLYREDDAPDPISHYGRTKLAAEQLVLTMLPRSGVARTSWLYGGSGKHFPRTVLNVVTDRGSIEVVDDEVGSPTFAGDLAVALLGLASSRGSGIFHLANAGAVSRHGLARETVRLAGLDPECVRATSTAEFLQRYPLPALRPPASALLNVRAEERGVALAAWDDALARYVPTLAFELGLPGNT